MVYECITVRTEAEKIGVVTLNRPKQLNALNDQLMNELGDPDTFVRAVHCTGDLPNLGREIL